MGNLIYFCSGSDLVIFSMLSLTRMPWNNIIYGQRDITTNIFLKFGNGIVFHYIYIIEKSKSTLILGFFFRIFVNLKKLVSSANIVLIIIYS